MSSTEKARGIAAALANVNAKLADLASLKADLEEQLAVELGAGTHDLGDVKVVVRSGVRRFDAKRFAAAYPPEAAPDLYKQAPDLDAVKRRFSPDDLAEYYGAPGKGSVTLK